jgi:hypothetical protein
MFKFLFNCISCINQNKIIDNKTNHITFKQTKHLTSKQIRRLKRRNKYTKGRAFFSRPQT